MLSRSTLACPCAEIQRKMLLMSSFLLLQQPPECLARLIGIVCEMGGKWLYNCCFLECRLPNLFETAHSISSSLFSKRFFKVQVVQPNIITNTVTTCKNCGVILSEITDKVKLNAWLFCHFCLYLENKYEWSRKPVYFVIVRIYIYIYIYMCVCVCVCCMCVCVCVCVYNNKIYIYI